MSMDFGEALICLRVGRPVTRSAWSGPTRRVDLQVPDENSKMSLPYLYLVTVRGQIPWTPTQVDILATDWVLY